MARYDIAIIGGGIVGSAIATSLATAVTSLPSLELSSQKVSRNAFGKP